MKKIACIVKGYPRLSETFIAQEILALEQAGIDLVIYSLRQPTDTSVHPVHQKISARVHYLPEYLHQHPIRVLLALIKVLFNRSFYKTLKIFLKDFKRDPTANRIRRFGQAMVLNREIDPDRQWLYVHFLHTPASVAYYTSHLSGLPWSCSAHAKDIWTSERWELAEKINDLRWLVTCTQSNTSYLKELTQHPEKVSLLYHGLDLSRFPKPLAHHQHNGSDHQQKIKIVSVGRAVNKKGYDILLNALSRLPDSLHWEFTHIGGGPLLDNLKQQADTLKFNDHIHWLGALNFEQVITHYQAADIFVLASRIDDNGDRDGLPNVLMEAMTQALPCIATNISGIPELITDQQNGILVEQQQTQPLTDAIFSLITDPAKRRYLGENGQQIIKEKFSLHSNVNALIERFK